MYYHGWYHFFYQHNPHGVVWGHAVSRDMFHWRHLSFAMVPNCWYDINDVFTGSATVLTDGKVILRYARNPNDPLLCNWTKHPTNPVILPPSGVHEYDFRDHITPWFENFDKTWRTVIGSKDNHVHADIAFMYKTKGFVKYELVPG